MKNTKLQNTESKILFAGFGGQGIIFMGKLLACAVMKEDKNVTWMPSYGAEVRGGTAHSMVIVSEEEIASPYVEEPDICVVMNNPSLERFEPLVKKGGTLFVNTSICDSNFKRKDINIIEIPATETAKKIGDVKIANMIIFGALIKSTNICELSDVVDCLQDLIPPHREKLIPLNKKALTQGASLKWKK